MDLEPSNQKSWGQWIWNQATSRLCVHGFETKHFSLHISLNQRSFDVDDTPCKDGGREYNNAVMCNCYVICSNKEVLDSATIPGVSLECVTFWEKQLETTIPRVRLGSVCIPGVIYANNANQSGLKHRSI